SASSLPSASTTRPSPAGTSSTAARRTRRLAIATPVSSRASELAPSEAVAQMVVHHARGLHKRVADRRPDEPKAAPDQVLAHRARDVRLGGTLAQSTPGVLGRGPADELPELSGRRP